MESLTPTLPDDSDSSAILGWIAIITTFVVGIVTGGGITLVAFSKAFKDLRADSTAISAIEGLTRSVPDGVADHMIDLSHALVELGKLLNEAFDRIPAAEKPPVQEATWPVPPQETVDPNDLSDTAHG